MVHRAPTNSLLTMFRSQLLKNLLNQNQQTKKCGADLRYFSEKVKRPRQVPRERPAVKKRSGGYPLLIIPLTCVGLGTWQIYRREWKLNLIKDLEKRMSVLPIELPENLGELSTMEYRKVKVKGTFDHAKELFVGPRSNVHDPQTLGGNRAENIGVHVVTPFKLSDRDETILVNRGHVPFQKQPPVLRKSGQVEGEVELIGVVRRSDRAPIIGSNPEGRGYWLTRNVEDMAEIADTSKVFLDADTNSTVPGGPSGGQTRVTLRNEHMTYIITWYSLAVITFLLWYKNYRSPKPHPAMIKYLKKEHKNL